MGSDHCCLKADLEIQRAPLEKRPKHKASRVLNLVGWKPSKEDEFKTFLNGRVASVEAGQVLKSLQERCEEIEDVLLEAAKLNQHAETEIIDTSAILEARLHNMIDERKEARVARDKEREKVVSKRIRKEIKAVTVARKRAKDLTNSRSFQRAQVHRWYQNERKTALHRSCTGQTRCQQIKQG